MELVKCKNRIIHPNCNYALTVFPCDGTLYCHAFPCQYGLEELLKNIIDCLEDITNKGDH